MKKIFIALMGGMVLLVGLAFLILPGPGLPIIAAGLAILSTEFLWARNAWRKAKIIWSKIRRQFGRATRHLRASEKDIVCKEVAKSPVNIQPANPQISPQA